MTSCSKKETDVRRGCKAPCDYGGDKFGALRRARCSCHVSSLRCRCSHFFQLGLRGSDDWEKADSITRLTSHLSFGVTVTHFFPITPPSAVIGGLSEGASRFRSPFPEGSSRSIPRSGSGPGPGPRTRVAPACHCGRSGHNDNV